MLTQNKVASGMATGVCNGAATRSDSNAIADRFQIDLTMRSAKPPVTHGVNGVSQKASGVGRASHYVSLTRLTNVRVHHARRKEI